MAAGLVGLVPKPINAATASTLYQCYQQRGMAWGTVAKRAVTAAESGIFYYRGTASQNIQLKNVLCNDKLGYSVATGYQRALRVGASASQDYFQVTSLALRDGTILDINTLGGKVFLNIEPGSTKEEIVMCTGINTSTIRFTDCTRGLAFSGTSTASVSTNAKTHNASSIVVMSNVHYVYEQFVDVNNKEQTLAGNKTVTGTWTFSNSLPRSTTTAPTLNEELVTLGYLTTVTTTGCANASASVRGCVQESSESNAISSSITDTGSTGAKLYITPTTWQNNSDIHLIGEYINGGTIMQNDVVYMSSSGKYFTAHATSQAEIDRIVGVARASTSGTSTALIFYAPGTHIKGTNVTTYTPGQTVYLGDDGRGSVTPGTIRKVIGRAVKSDSWVFMPDLETPTSTAGTAFTPLMTNSGGTLTTTILTTSTNASQVLRNVATGATWDTLKSYSGNFTFTGGGAITTTIGFEPKTINFSCGGQSGSGSWNTSITDGYWVATGTQFTVGTTATSGSGAQNEYTSGIVGAVRGGGGASYNQLTVAVSATSTSGFTVTATQANGPTTINCIYTAREF